MYKNSEIEIIKLPDYKYLTRNIKDINSQYNYNKEKLMPNILFGRILVENQQGLQGLLDLDGQLAIDCKYERIDGYSDRFIKISRLDEKDVRYYGVLDYSGKMILPCDCSEIIIHSGYKDSKMDRLIYHLNGCWGVCNLTGQDILPLEFDELKIRFLTIEENEVMVFIVSKENLWGAYDIYGDELIACDKESVITFPKEQYQNPEYLVFKKNDKTNITDYRGNWLKDKWYQKEIEGFIPSEKPVFLKKYETIYEDKFDVDKYDKEAESLLEGKIISSELDENGAVVKERMGYQDEKGNIILKMEYAKIKPIGKYLLAAKHHEDYLIDRWQLYDKNGKSLFKEDLRDIVMTNTGKIACVCYDWENVDYLDYMYFYDEDKNSYYKITDYNSVHKSPPVAPYYVAGKIDLDAEITFGLVDGDGNIVIKPEYEFYYKANDYRVDNSLLACKNRQWYLIRVDQKILTDKE